MIALAQKVMLMAGLNSSTKFFCRTDNKVKNQWHAVLNKNGAAKRGREDSDSEEGLPCRQNQRKGNTMMICV